VSKDPIAYLARDGRRFELTFPEYGLTVRGPYAEWVLEAAAEIIGKLERTKAESAVEELNMLKNFGDENVSDLDVESTKYEQNLRFETVPQCVVTMNDMDYRWVSRDGRRGDGKQQPIERLHDMSLTRNGTFLVNQQ
jgi:hypothetical protein